MKIYVANEKIGLREFDNKEDAIAFIKLNM